MGVMVTHVEVQNSLVRERSLSVPCALVPRKSNVAYVNRTTVKVTGTTTSGKPLSAENLRKALDGCTMALALDEDKRTLLSFVESRCGLKHLP